MNIRRILCFACIVALPALTPVHAAPREGGNFGFGLTLGEPSGLTMKYWTAPNRAWDFYIGGSYFGSPRIGADYLWHFPNAAPVLRFYAGLGGTIGFGHGHGYWYNTNQSDFYYRADNSAGLAARGLFGLTVVPHSTPLEFFAELGVLVGVTPAFGSAADVALGIRFYP